MRVPLRGNVFMSIYGNKSNSYWGGCGFEFIFGNLCSSWKVCL